MHVCARCQGSAAMMEGSKKMIAMRLAKHEQAVVVNAKLALNTKTAGALG